MGGRREEYLLTQEVRKKMRCAALMHLDNFSECHTIAGTPVHTWCQPALPHLLCVSQSRAMESLLISRAASLVLHFEAGQ